MREEPLRNWHPGEVAAVIFATVWLAIFGGVIAVAWLVHALGVVG